MDKKVVKKGHCDWKHKQPVSSSHPTTVIAPVFLVTSLAYPVSVQQLDDIQ